MDEKEPNNIVTFKYHSKIDKKDYNGMFKVKRISVFGINEIQVTGNELTRGLGAATPSHSLLVQRMATIDHVIEEVLEGAEWFEKGNTQKTWAAIHDTKLAELLYKEVVKYDDWFRKGDAPKDDQKENKESSSKQLEESADSTNSVGGKKSKHEQEKSGVSEVIVG